MYKLELTDGRIIEVNFEQFEFLIRCVFTGDHMDKVSKIDTFHVESQPTLSGFEYFLEVKKKFRQKHGEPINRLP